ncbi:MAG TPA: TIGR03545 family protein [Bacteroidota bacterium]|nr:TIGR03545 family protein [Bacteroidota bacterium]
MIRKRFVYIVLIPLVILGIITYLFIDTWIETGLEAAGEAFVGAKVEIDGLRLTLSPIALEFARMQVANPKDPWNNIFETGRVRAALDFGQLLRGKYIVETVEVNELILGTKRATDGSLPQKPKEPDADQEPSLIQQASSVVVQQARQAPVFDLEKIKREFKIDSLLNVHNLRSVQHIDTLKLRVQQAYDEWKATLADIEKSKHKLSEIEANVKAINLNELKTIDQFIAAANNANNAYKAINDLNETFKTRRASITTQVNTLAASVDVIDDLARQDYEWLKSLARLPDLSMKGLANLLVGKQLLDEVNYYLGWIDYARNTIPRYIPRPDYEKPPRFEGQDIHFPTERSYPKLWIKKILISGGEDKAQRENYFYAKGEANDISSDQRVTGKPLTIELEATKGGGRSFSLSMLFDRRQPEPLDRYRAKAAGIPLGDIELGRSDFLPATISQSKFSVDVLVNVPGQVFEANVGMKFDDIALVFERAPKNDVERIVRDVLAGVKGFYLGLRLWNTKGTFDVAFTTDLDDQLAARTKKVIGDEIVRLQNELRAKVNQRIAEKRQEFEQLFNQRKEEVLARVKQYENLVNEKLALAENKKKELEMRIEEEKRKQAEGAKKKLEDALRGLIKKQ